MIRAIIGACLTAALLGCGREEPPPPLPEIADPSFPDVPEADRIDLPAPAAPPALRWDLSPGRLHSYRLREDVTSTKTVRCAGKPDDRSVARLHSEGFMDVRGLGDGPGRVEYKMTPREYAVGGRAQNVNAIPPTLFSARLSEDGAVSDVQPVKAQGPPVLLDLLVAPPAAPLAPGQVVERRVDIAAQEGRPAMHGSARTTLTGYAKVGPYACARLVTELDVALVPAAEGRGRSRARIVAYFAFEERRLVRVDAAVATAAAVRTTVVDRSGNTLWSVGTLEATTRFTALLGELR